MITTPFTFRILGVRPLKRQDCHPVDQGYYHDGPRHQMSRIEDGRFERSFASQ